LSFNTDGYFSIGFINNISTKTLNIEFQTLVGTSIKQRYRGQFLLQLADAIISNNKIKYLNIYVRDNNRWFYSIFATYIMHHINNSVSCTFDGMELNHIDYNDIERLPSKIRLRHINTITI
jgi:hypothetical protein